ncbi:hypothetical protein WJX84_006961 [Apatococcus fuscideae]|uniref:CBS domain-containing protein n=1 Tax=Apatococcus fuscideae TaxID=2026836 RepID=A0AAW1T2R5_9CHLO
MQALLPCGVSARHLSHRGASSSSHPETSEPCRCHLTWSRCAPDSHTQVQRRAFSYQTGAEASRLVAHAASVVEAGPLTAIGHGPYETVEDLMTKKRVFTCRADTSIDEALELLVANKITGLPVVDEDGTVVGVVSDYDLLSLDQISGKMQQTGMFPDTNTEWQAFKEVQKLVVKNAGRVVADVMTPEPLVVRPQTNVEAAARILLERKVRRLPVVDENGYLVGVFTRGDVIKAALESRRAALNK